MKTLLYEKQYVQEHVLHILKSSTSKQNKIIFWTVHINWQRTKKLQNVR